MSDPLTAPVEHLSHPLMQVRCLLMTGCRDVPDTDKSTDLRSARVSAHHS